MSTAGEFSVRDGMGVFWDCRPVQPPNLVITPIPAANGKTYHVDLRISGNAYTVAVDGTVVNTLLDRKPEGSVT